MGKPGLACAGLAGAGVPWTALLGLALACPGAAQGRAEAGVPNGPGWADPSDALAAQIAFARLSRDRGDAAAYKATAARDAQIYAPSAARVAEILGKRGQLPSFAGARPYAAWMSCDGSYAVTSGGWRTGGGGGWFATVWQRQDKGNYALVLGVQGDEATPRAEPDFLDAKVADCPARAKRDEGAGHGGNRKAPAGRPQAVRPLAYLEGKSDDGTLAWSTGATSGAPSFSLRLRQGDGLREVATFPVR